MKKNEDGKESKGKGKGKGKERKKKNLKNKAIFFFFFLGFWLNFYFRLCISSIIFFL